LLTPSHNYSVKQDKESEEIRECIHVLCGIRTWSEGLLREFDNLEHVASELLPHLNKIKEVVMNDIEDNELTWDEIMYYSTDPGPSPLD
tara:strand:+ start:233 stop:499 length:267 start_codon:yes stop_codon:yes gene_type:complete